MRRPREGESFVCPNCHKPVDPSKPNAMMSAVTDLWQHKDCWTEKPMPADSASPDEQPYQGPPRLS
jgi:hypothetical protein